VVFKYFFKGFQLSLTLNTRQASWQRLRNFTLIRSDKHANARLYELSHQIHQWNIARVLTSGKQALSIEDIHDLKEIIQSCINKVAIKQPDVIADQLLFLAIGAIQIEAQNGSDQAWQLVNRAIHNIAKPKKTTPSFLHSAGAILLAACLFTAINIQTKTHTVAPVTPFAMAVNNSPDPVTISMLNLTYHKMKSGTCQLPQAAMLPPEQRHAFLLFVNTGTVDVLHVEDLRLALGYVNCLYPQELMHPMPT
jgi:hypothetical protein